MALIRYADTCPTIHTRRRTWRRFQRIEKREHRRMKSHQNVSEIVLATFDQRA
jgi:hypothetical protein